MPIHGVHPVDMGDGVLHKRTIYLYKGVFYIQRHDLKVEVEYNETTGFVYKGNT